MPKPDGFDQSWGYADPKKAKAAGIEAVMMYLSYDSSKNATAEKVKAYHAEGIGVFLGWEYYSNRALEGAAAGKSDAEEVVRQVRALEQEVGYSPANQIEIYAAVDFDTSSSEYPALDAYMRAFCSVLHHASLLGADYSEYDYVQHAAAAGVDDAHWQTYAWSGGRVSKHAAVLQYLNGQKFYGADVDYDRIFDAAKLGAWWPPNHPLNQGENMPITDDDAKKVAHFVWDRELSNGAGAKHSARTWLLGTNLAAHRALDAAEALEKATAGLASVLNDAKGGVVVRIAAVQKALAELKPAKIEDADAAKVATAVLAGIRGLVFGVKA